MIIIEPKDIKNYHEVLVEELAAKGIIPAVMEECCILLVL